MNKDAQSYDTTLSLTSTNSLLLKAALAQGSSSGPRPAPPPRPRNIAVPRDGSSTLNYLYTPGVEQVEQVEQVEPVQTSKVGRLSPATARTRPLFIKPTSIICRPGCR